MRILSERIRQRREALGLRQQDLAAKLHTSAQAVSKWERGENDPDIIHLPLLARHLGVTIDWLMAVESVEPFTTGTVLMVGVTTARLRGAELSPRSFAAWCQAVLDRSIAAVEAAGGVAVTSHGPGLLATFTGGEHGADAWRAIRSCCQIHAVPLKIGVSHGDFHVGEIRIGHRGPAPDVFGDAVSTALVLADWVAEQVPARSHQRHAIAWQGSVPERAGAPERHHPQLAELSPVQRPVSDVSCWFPVPG